MVQSKKMKTKKCTKCGKDKDVKEFAKAKTGKYGVRGDCKQCREQAQKIYRDNNKDQLNTNSANYYLKNKEQILERCKKYYINNKDVIDKRNKQWGLNNKEQRRDYLRNKRRTDEKYRILCALRTRLNTSIKHQHKSLSSMVLIGCEIDYLMYHLQEQFTEGMSWDNYGKGGWEIDHIKPCMLFDLTKESEQLICFNYTNLQPLWAIDNLRKGSDFNGN